MKKIVLALSLCCISTLTFANNDEMLSKYGKVAESTVKTIQTASFEDISKSSTQLVNLAKEVLPAFTKRQPACNAYLGAVMAAADSMQKITLEEIEADYHADGKLPALTSGDCYHAKDLLVHPATVVVMAKTLKDTEANRKQMAHELEEVIVHLSLVKAAVK